MAAVAKLATMLPRLIPPVNIMITERARMMTSGNCFKSKTIIIFSFIYITHIDKQIILSPATEIV